MHNLSRFAGGLLYKGYEENNEYWSIETGLSDNPTLPWSLDFILRYQDKLNLSSMNESSILFEKGILPLLNDEFVEEFLKSS